MFMIRPGEEWDLPWRGWHVTAGYELTPPRRYACMAECVGPTRFLFDLEHCERTEIVSVCFRCAMLLTRQRDFVRKLRNMINNNGSVRQRWESDWRCNEKGNWVRRFDGHYVTICPVPWKKDTWTFCYRSRFYGHYPSVKRAKDAVVTRLAEDILITMHVPEKIHLIADPNWEKEPIAEPAPRPVSVDTQKPVSAPKHFTAIDLFGDDS